jgi:hypothetical protein
LSVAIEIDMAGQVPHPRRAQQLCMVFIAMVSATRLLFFNGTQPEAARDQPSSSFESGFLLRLCLFRSQYLQARAPACMVLNLAIPSTPLWTQERLEFRLSRSLIAPVLT